MEERGERNIKVGIKTSGAPIFKRCKDFTLLENMLIGDGFHWENSITVKLPGKIDIVDGDFSNRVALSEADRNITLINTLPLETYLESVVGSEMNPTAPIEFIKAHAVISRSWALGKISRIHNFDKNGAVSSDHTLIGWDDTAGHQFVDVCSDDHCQRYQGLQPIPEETIKAIRETEGEVLVDKEGKIVDTRFSKCCGGTTETFNTCWQSQEVNCLESFKDPWCNLSDLSYDNRNELLTKVLKSYDLSTEDYGYRWESEITKPEIKKNLRERFGRNIGEIKQIEPLQRGPSGRIHLLRIKGSQGYLDLGKELWIRRLLSPTHLYSSAFDIQDTGEKIRLKGKGWGHGVGLCQIGAANMALKGYTYQEILSFYYPHSSLKKN